MTGRIPVNQVWQSMPVISALSRWRQEDHAFEASLGYESLFQPTKK
jgi:hypothetical protein